MKIIFTGLEPEARGTANGMLLKGKKDYDGSEYEKFFFDKSKQGDLTDLGKAAGALKAGDIVELTYDDSKFKNLLTITVLGSGGDTTAAPSKGKSSAGASNRNTGKSNYRDPDHTDRSSAMYLAWDIVSKMAGIKGDKAVAVKAQPSISAQFEDLTKKLEGYLHTGQFVCPREPGSDDDADAGADPLASQGPDDDIPF